VPRVEVQFVDKKFFPEENYMRFDDIKPGLDKVLNALKEKCKNINIDIDESELRILEMMTGKFTINSKI
jgi:hypothetical protein